MTRVLVSGAGGFIGSWLVRRLCQEGYWVRGADLKYPEWTRSPANEFAICDLRIWEDVLKVTTGMDWVFALAATMGGMGFISTADAEIISDNTRIDMNMIEAAKQNDVKKFLFSSSACCYPCYLQESDDPPL